jgi:hypothetical protein
MPGISLRPVIWPPGNTLQNVGNLLKPALLIGFLAASRRAEHSPDSEVHTSGFDIWRGPRIQAAGLITGCVAAGFSVGFAIDQPVIGTLVGTPVGAGVAAFVIARSSGGLARAVPTQQFSGDQDSIFALMHNENTQRKQESALPCPADRSGP